MNKDHEDLIKTMKSRKENSSTIPLNIIKFDAFFEEIEKDRMTGIVEISTPDNIVRIFLKKGKTLKCFINDKEASIFEIQEIEHTSGTLSIYRTNEQVLDLMVLFSGAKPREMLSSEYADIRKYLQIKERDHFSGIVEFYEEEARGFLRLDNGKPQNGIFISQDGISFFSDALSKIMDRTHNFQIRSYDVKTVRPSSETVREILSHTDFSIHHKIDPRKLLTEFETFAPENAEEIGTIQLHPHQDKLYMVQDEKETIGLEFVYETTIYKFVHWVLKDFFLELAQENVNRVKYVWYWIPECDNVEFFKEFPVNNNKVSWDVVFTTTNGDLLMQNPLGELLFVARFLTAVSRDDLQKFVEEGEQFKNTRIDTGDVGAVFLVAETFEEAAVDLARALTGKSLPDKLAKLEGFYRTSREAGFHLILVEKDPFTMIFP